MKNSVLVLLFLILNFNSAFLNDRVCAGGPWLGNSVVDDCQLSNMDLEVWSGLTGSHWTVSAKIRNSYLDANPFVPFKGNIIYYQGLADSMLNHMPLFNKLTNAGYRFIAFDYKGQGGSTGSMNDTRIYEIVNMGDFFWNSHGLDLVNYPKKTILGWSTGGLIGNEESC